MCHARRLYPGRTCRTGSGPPLNSRLLKASATNSCSTGLLKMDGSGSVSTSAPGRLKYRVNAPTTCGAPAPLSEAVAAAAAAAATLLWPLVLLRLPMSARPDTLSWPSASLLLENGEASSGQARKSVKWCAL